MGMENIEECALNFTKKNEKQNTKYEKYQTQTNVRQFKKRQI